MRHWQCTRLDPWTTEPETETTLQVGVSSGSQPRLALDPIVQNMAPELGSKLVAFRFLAASNYTVTIPYLYANFLSFKLLHTESL